MASKPPAVPELEARLTSTDPRTGLDALIEVLAQALVEGSLGVKAQISAQLRAARAERAALTDGEEMTVADDLAARRKARRAAAQAAASAAGEGQ